MTHGRTMELLPGDESLQPTADDRMALRSAVYAVTNDSVVGQLRAIGTIRRLLPLFEEDAVRAARKEGFSWMSIGFWMGVSHQSVIKRWRRALHGDAYDPTSWRRRPDRLPPAQGPR